MWRLSAMCQAVAYISRHGKTGRSSAAQRSATQKAQTGPAATHFPSGPSSVPLLKVWPKCTSLIAFSARLLGASPQAPLSSVSQKTWSLPCDWFQKG
jgi:hypothetical protein